MAFSSITRRLFTVEEYHQMVCAGVLHEDDRVELIEGEIIEMTPIGRRHVACVDRLTRLFSLRLGKRVIVRIQGPARLNRRSEPQPDVTLLRPRDDFYEKCDAGPADILLMVEVSDTSLAYDREVKLRLYARAGIPEVWLVDLSWNCIEVHRRPSPAGYGWTESFTGAEALSIQEIPDFTVRASQIVPGVTTLGNS